MLLALASTVSHLSSLFSLRMDCIENTASKNFSLLHDIKQLLPSSGPGIVDAAVYVCCHGDVFTGRCLAVDDFFGPAILAFSHHGMMS
jgi:hypothetical protein